MGVYILNSIFAWFFLLLARRVNYGNKSDVIEGKNHKLNILSKTFVGISFVCIFLVAGLRVEVGSDYNNYADLFNKYLWSEWNFIPNIEPLFFYFTKTIGLFTSNHQWLFIIAALIIYVPYYKVSISETKYFELSVFLFLTLGFYTSSFNLMRQWIGSAIAFYGFLCVFRGKTKRSVISFIIAIFFHYSAAVVLIMLPFIKGVKSAKFRNIVIALSTISFLVYDKVLGLVFRIMVLLNMPTKYYQYQTELALNHGRFFVFPTICITIYVLYSLKHKTLKKISRNIEQQINILTVAYIFSLLGQRLYIFLRVQYYFLPIIIVMIPNLLFLFDKKSRILAYGIILVLGFLFMVYTLLQNGGSPLPYNSIFT